MKSNSFRRPLPSHNHARIIKSVRDSCFDVIVPLSYALEEYDKGRLIPVDLGKDYPMAFMRVT